MTTFNQPATSSGFLKAADHNGHLILITTVHRFEERYDEMKGAETTIAIVDLVDLDFDMQLRENIIITPLGIVNRLRPGATNVLGRIGQVPTKKGHPAWVLNDATNDATAIAAATAWVEKQKAGAFTQPATPATTPTPTPAAAAPVIDPTGLSVEQLAALRALITQ